MVENGSPASDHFAGKVCVVTGGLGFIGSNLVHRLVSVGAKVRVIDALVAAHGGDIRNVDGLDVDVEVCELGDDRARPIVRDADTIFNLAGQVSHLASMLDPQRDFHYNAVSHVDLLEMVRQTCPTARVVHTSTRQVYGRPVSIPVDESHPTHPLDVNGVAKLAGEQMHMVYAHAYRMPITSLRLTNVYGPRQRLTSDELGFLPVFIRRALLGETIEVFGDGSQRRDCVYVSDVVDALMAATAHEAVGKVFNVGGDVDHSLAEVARITIASSGRGELRCRGWPEEQERIDIGSFRSDSSAIRSCVGWAASTALADGMSLTCDFYKDHPWYLSST